MTRETLDTTRDFDDGLDADLLGALENGPDHIPEPAPEPQPDTAAPAKPDDPFPQSGRARDEQGRFATKPKEEAPAGPDAAQGTEPPLKAWEPLWLKTEHGVEWDKLPEPFRKAIEQRERESAQAITQHSTRAKAWEPIDRVFDEVDPRTGRPYTEQLQQAGVTKQEYLGNLVQWDKNFREDPLGSAIHLLNNLGIDPAKLADHMTAQPAGQATADPRVMQELQALRQEVSTLKSGRTDETRRQQHEMIAEWAKDKPYFSDLRPYMAALAKENPKATLDQLYESAQYAHPTTRERILRDQRKRDADRARQAGVSARGYPNGAGAPAAKLSLDEELGAALDEAGYA